VDSVQFLDSVHSVTVHSVTRSAGSTEAATSRCGEAAAKAFLVGTTGEAVALLDFCIEFRLVGQALSGRMAAPMIDLAARI
jgi:hypothetical protein